MPLVLLAAGASSRMAVLGHKLMLPCYSWQILHSHYALPLPLLSEVQAAFYCLTAPPLFAFSLATVRSLAERTTSPVFITLDPQGPAPLKQLCSLFALPDWHIVETPPAKSPQGGQTASLQAALKAALATAPSLPGLCVFLADMPLADPTLAWAVWEFFWANKEKNWDFSCVAPVFQGTHGHPVALHHTVFPAIQHLGPEEKLWPLLAPTARLLPVQDPACLFDIDTPEAYRTMDGIAPRSPLAL